MAKRVKVRLVEVREAEVDASDLDAVLDNGPWRNEAAWADVRDRFFSRSYVSRRVEQGDAEDWRHYPVEGKPRPPRYEQGDQLAVFYSHKARDFMFYHPRDRSDGRYAYGFLDGHVSFPEFLREMWTRGFDPRSLVLKLTYRKDLLNKNRAHLDRITAPVTPSAPEA